MGAVMEAMDNLGHRGRATAGPVREPLKPGSGSGAAQAGHRAQVRSDVGQRQAATPEEAAPRRSSAANDAPAEEIDRAHTQPHGDGERQEFRSVHAYGRKAALCFSADETRKGRLATVRIEGAESIGERRYDWQQKIAIQLTAKELPVVLAVFMGWLPEVRFQNHGPQKDKAVSLKNQEKGIVFVSVQQGRAARAVPVTATEVYPVVSLLVEQMMANSPHLTAEALLMVVRAMAGRYADAASAGATPGQ